MAERKENPDLFFAHLERALQPKDELARRDPIYEDLYKLRGVFVTTNADELFTRFFNPEAVVHRPEEFPGTEIDRAKLYHTHGIIRDRESLVFRLEDYIRRYGSPRIEQFLKTLFSKFTILFVGYGLSELQLLEYLTLHNSPETRVIRHYYLTPMYQGEDSILEFEQAHYGRLGIQVVAYDKTEAGYCQLYHVIHEWQSEINRVTASLLNTYEYIEQAVSQYDGETAGRVFQLIKHDKPYEDHFFKHVSSPHWLIPLRDRDYFDPSKNPPPVELRDNPGFVTVPYWNVLGYLERVAAQLDAADSYRYSVLTKIIRDIADYRVEGGERIENFRTDWSVTKILSKVPANYLEPNDMDRVSEFLHTP